MKKLFNHYTTAATLLLLCSAATGIFYFSVPAESVFKIPLYWLLLSAAINLTIAFVLIILSARTSKDSLFQFSGWADPLTGLWSFGKFCSKLKSRLTKNSRSKFAILYFDIDNFKVINDTFGYDFGDLVLCHIAKVMRETLTNGELFTRFTNDFFVLCKEYENESEIYELAELLIKKLKNSRINDTSLVEIPISCGIFFVTDNHADVNEIINKANIARSSAKQQGKEKYAVFNNEIRIKMAYELQIEKELRHALENKQLEVYYQPQFSLSTGKMSGMEALVRWRHPETGFIPPSVFIPIAEKKGLVVEVGRFVFEEVCRSINGWRQNKNEDITVCVNLSRVELYQPDLIDFVKKTIKKYNVTPEMIDIELTETAAISDLDFINTVISQLKALGFSIAMDDFGTGYSSLSCLKRIPIDVLKLDRSFMLDLSSDPDSANIVKAIIKLAKSLGFEVVAEGIETREQADFLYNAGCDVGQGFYYARPMPKKDLENILATPIDPLMFTHEDKIIMTAGAAEFITEYFTLYFRNRNFEHLASSFSDDISWIGKTSYSAGIGRKQTLEAVENELADTAHSYDISSVNLTEQCIGEGICLVTGTFAVNSLPPAMPTDFGIIRVTAICITKEDGIKIGHIHYSRPFYDTSRLNISEDDPSYLKVIEYYSNEKMDRDFAELIMKLYKKNKLLSDLVSSDGLTCLYNHKYIHDCVQRCMQDFENFGTPFSLMMIDLDNFKEINDENGHPTGDEVLVRVSGIIKRCLDENSIAGRYGGDEFLILLPGSGIDEARICAENLKETIESEEFTELKIRVSCSIGVSEMKEGMDSKILIKTADDNLYKAKALGKRAVVS